MMSTHFDNDFYIQKRHTGVCILPYDKLKSDYANNAMPLATLLKPSFNIYLMDKDSRMITINDSGADTMGFQSPTSTIGRSVFDIAKPENALKVRQNDLEVLSTEKTKIIEEDLFRLDNECFQTLTVKTPCYNHENKLMGILGFSIIIGTHALDTSLTHIASLGILKSTNPSIHNNIYLSKREMDCARLLVLGKTAKEISFQLGLSKRTVEHYIENIKCKMNVSKKSELIEKLIYNTTQ